MNYDSMQQRGGRAQHYGGNGNGNYVPCSSQSVYSQREHQVPNTPRVGLKRYNPYANENNMGGHLE